MLTLPEIVSRPQQAYAYINFTVSMDELQTPAAEGFPTLFDHLGALGIAPVGAPFYNYRRIDMSATLDVEAGVAVAQAGPDSERVRFGTLPAGRFIQMRWHGHPDKLEQVTGLLIGWVQLTQQPLDMEEKPDGDHFACRLEIYETDPVQQPDMNEWWTELSFKLAD